MIFIAVLEKEYKEGKDWKNQELNLEDLMIENRIQRKNLNLLGFEPALSEQDGCTTHPASLTRGEELPYVGYMGMCHRPGPFFTSKNPEQAPNFEVLLQNRPYFLKVYSRTGSFFDNLVSNAQLKCQNPSCFQLLFPAAWCLHFCSIILEQVFQAFYNWDQFESGHMFSSLNLTWIYHCG